MPWKFVLTSETDPNCQIELETEFYPPGKMTFKLIDQSTKKPAQDKADFEASKRIIQHLLSMK